MPGHAHEIARLIGALDDLVGREEVLFAASDIDGVVAVQGRAAPLVTRLAELAPSADADARARVARLLGRRGTLAQQLARAAERLRVELAEVQTSEAQCARLAPAYVVREVPRQRLSLAL